MLLVCNILRIYHLALDSHFWLGENPLNCSLLGLKELITMALATDLHYYNMIGINSENKPAWKISLTLLRLTRNDYSKKLILENNQQNNKLPNDSFKQCNTLYLNSKCIVCQIQRLHTDS